MRVGRCLQLLAAICLIGLTLVLNTALAATVKVSDADSLELRNAVLPDGTELEYYVVTGAPATITIDDEDQIIAEQLEIDTTNNVIRIIGFGIIRVDEQETQGRDLTFNLEDETFQGENVLIVTEALDVIGADANRVPGQISVVTGRFSPCSRCEQQVEDYGFRAQRLELFPGDRLIAYDVNILIKGAPVFFLPLLVLPLGPPDRQPRLSIEGGTATTRAEAELVWPYIAGGTALGTVALQYYADVTPGEGNFFSNTFLGGRVDVNYLGGEVNHRFYTDEGQGSFVVAYVPDFIEYSSQNGVRVPLPPDPDTPFFPEDEFRVRFEYATDAERAGPSTRVVVNRDDAASQRIVDFEVELADTIGDYEITLATRGFIDLQPDDNVDINGSPRRSATINIEPEEAVEYSAGPFSLSNIRLNLGIFEARPNSNNRSAVLSAREVNETGTSVLSAGRLITSQTLRLDTIRPWGGLEIDASSSFTGQYYSTRNAPLEDEENGELERFINWNSNVSLRQSLGGSSSLSLGFVRNINEGETPFAFDSLSLGSSTYLDAGLNLSPFAWLSLNANTRYLFVDSRSNFVGLDPLVTSLRLFDNLDWISLEFSNSYDFRGPEPELEGNRSDPGELRTSLTLNVPEPDLDASLTVTYVDDLDPTISRGRLNPDGGRDESELDISYRFGIPPYFSTDVSLGYQPDPPEVDDDEVRQFFKPFNAGFTFGSSDQSDRVPGLRIGFERDLNANETSELELEFTAALEPFKLRLQQDFNVRDERISFSNYELTWNNVARFEASGFALLPPSVLGLELNDERTENRRYQIAEEPRG